MIESFFTFSFALSAMSYLKIGDRQFLDSSSSAVKADGYRLPLDNHRNLAGALGMLQHGVEMLGLFDDVIIVHLAAFFGKCFTSCPGVRSSILSEKQNFVGHFSPWAAWLPPAALQFQLYIITKIYKNDRINRPGKCQ